MIIDSNHAIDIGEPTVAAEQQATRAGRFLIVEAGMWPSSDRLCQPNSKGSSPPFFFLRTTQRAAFSAVSRSPKRYSAHQPVRECPHSRFKPHRRTSPSGSGELAWLSLKGSRRLDLGKDGLLQRPGVASVVARPDEVSEASCSTGSCLLRSLTLGASLFLIDKAPRASLPCRRKNGLDVLVDGDVVTVSSGYSGEGRGLPPGVWHL
ncbi:hypothetical protein LX32DRAFT_215945 [Colletotrichum zoysiae]|uniref:Uncharacterized protein n=1 Tax=Colletotrichum zoysiae TaxID=1216348 RepID=A0AAD9H411_9PEZI|nr:hypothetical protein LX32DRAFT_215945 [Colletotrichum zoysiae]